MTTTSSDIPDPAELIIRDAKQSEFPALAALQIRSWRNVYRGILADDYLDNEIEQDLGDRWAALQPSGDDLVLVADQDGIVGFVTVWCKPHPYIDNLHVEPGGRSRGIGRRLMQAAADRLIQNGYDRVSLYVAAQNRRAAAFYRNLGGRFGDIERLHQEHGGDVEAIEVVWEGLAGLAAAD
ncbi:MAG: GNAT family N-acetyltransferase [Geminicoccaceae bacterium]